jgi:hypothetical protein
MIAGTKHLAAGSTFDGLEFSTAMHQSLGDSVRDPHWRLLRGGRIFGIGLDIPSPTLSQFQSWPRRVQTAAGSGEQTLSAAFQVGEPRRAGGPCRPRRQNRKQPVARSSRQTCGKTLNPCRSRSGGPTAPLHVSPNHQSSSAARRQRRC